MSLIYCGIDEAGYGPLLGPLCVGMSVFRVDRWEEGDAAPDLWDALGSAVCREANDKRHRIAVDDSKKLKLANSSARRHPLHHLERGVLSFLACRESPACAEVPLCDLSFLRAIGVVDGPEVWYRGEQRPFPNGPGAGEVAIAVNTLRLALTGAGVAVVGLKAEAVGEGAFNELVQAAGTKAAATESVLVRYLAEVWERFAADSSGESAGVRVVCDRQGGRMQYSGLLSRIFPDATVETTAETPSQSRYTVRSRPGSGEGRAMTVLFKTEAESAHLPVALASMLAKLTRELMMARFNRYWCNRVPELKPTAGYALDARRWLHDVREVISAQERRALVRRA